MITGALVSVATTVGGTLIATVATGDHPQSFAVQNVSLVDIFIGAVGVTTAAYGFKLGAGQTITIDLARGESLYGIVAASTANVAVLRGGTV